MKSIYIVSAIATIVFFYFTFKKLMQSKIIDKKYNEHLQTVMHESNKAKGRFE